VGWVAQMMLDKETGRYHLLRNKLIRLFVRSPKTDEGWEVSFEIGKLYNGPGIWLHTGKHSVLTIWLTSDRSVDFVYLCGNCSLCELLYDRPTGSRRKLKVMWT